MKGINTMDNSKDLGLDGFAGVNSTFAKDISAFSLEYFDGDYDAMGHRIAKHIYDNIGTTLERSTYYILDAKGNQISTYDHEVVSETAQFNLKEGNIFGSSRLGSKQDSINVLTATITQNYTQVLGTKYYEFSNLPITIGIGNVLMVFNDIKIGVDSNTDGVVDGYVVGLTNSIDKSGGQKNKEELQEILIVE